MKQMTSLLLNEAFVVKTKVINVLCVCRDKSLYIYISGSRCMWWHKTNTHTHTHTHTHFYIYFFPEVTKEF